MSQRHALAAVATALLLSSGPVLAASLPQVEVFKSPYCGCCGAWVDHMKAAGFQVKVTQVADTSASRKSLGLPDSLASCHSAKVGNYALEGHVPAAEVRRLVASKSNALGLAVPGMPASAPGMDAPGRRDAYQVLLLDKKANSTVFASYPLRSAVE